MLTYTINQLIGNYLKEVFTSEDFNEIQDYLENELNAAIASGEVDPEKYEDVELFYSYYHISEK